MKVSCLLLSLTLNFSKRGSLQRLLFTFSSNCNRSGPFKLSVHRSGIQISGQRGVFLSALSVMQSSGIYGEETSGVASDGEDDEEEGCGGESMVDQESQKDQEMIVSGANQKFAEATTVSSPTEPQDKIKNKVKRERRKFWKKKLKSVETSANLLSELPFALASPTTWKELGFPNPESLEKKRKRKRGEGDGRVDSEEDMEKKKKKKQNQRPNYFVSIPITNAEIKSDVSEVQQAILQQEPRLAKAMIPVPTLHITLLVTHLASPEQVQLAAAALTQVEASLGELLGGRDLVLPFSGISHFRKEVVFVGLASGQHRHTLDRLAEILQSRFEEQGLLQGDSRGFEPHLTIMKMSRASKLRLQGIKRVDPALYSDYANKSFGNQTVDRLDLCSMLKKKQPDGYYHTETSLQLDLTQSPIRVKRSSGRRRSEPDEAELLRVSRRLVEDAINSALQQYKQETLQNGGGPNTSAKQLPGSSDEAKTDTTTINCATDNRK